MACWFRLISGQSCQAGLAIAEVEAAASRYLIGHREEGRLAVALKKLCERKLLSQRYLLQRVRERLRLCGIMNLVGDGGGLTILRGDDGVDILYRQGGTRERESP
jgi:hypothetical protein